MQFCLTRESEMPNYRVEHPHGVRSTRNGDAPLLAAHAGR